MGTTVDSLEIQLQAQAGKANTAIDTLISKLDTLNTSLTKINGSGLSGVANGVDKLSRSMQGLKNVGTADYTRLAKGIEKISNLDSGQISKAATAIVGFGKGLQSLNSVNVSKTSEQVADLAKGISQLGYKSSTKAIENIPLLASAMKKLMSELSKAPRVSQNLIDMTNALAKLARTGASSGRAANALGGSLNTYTKATHKASRGTKGLASALGKMYATYWLLFRAIGKIGDSITIASDLVEVQNVVDTVFGDMSSKVEEYAQKSIEQFGMSELSFKQYASRFQAMGSAMRIDTSSIESANSFLNKATGGYVGLSDSMADVSLTLTQLTADMASFYNVSQKDVAEDLSAIFTGETRPLRQYGIDLTQATLSEWAMKNGLDANVQSMSQAEKTMLRYRYVLANTSAAQGDFAKTSNTWANQIRILQEQVKKFATVIGTGFIAAFKPFVQTLNKVMAKVIDFTKNVLNALGQIFGWKFEISGGGISDDIGADLSESMGDVSTGTGNAAGNAGNLSDNLGSAAKNAKKLKDITLGIDELNINSPQKAQSTEGSKPDGGNGGSGGGGNSGVGSGGSGGLVTNFKPNEKLLEAYKSSIRTLEQLGSYIGNALSTAMENINWNSVYQKARNFGTGLAEFLNGLISPRLFYNLGKTIANSINTALHSVNAFAVKFDWTDFGKSLAKSLKGFFENWDAGLTAETFSNLGRGILQSVTAFVETLNDDETFRDIGQKIVDFICNIDYAGLFWDFAKLASALSNALLSIPLQIIQGAVVSVLTNVFGIDEEKANEIVNNSKIIEKIGSILGKNLENFLIPKPVQFVLDIIGQINSGELFEKFNKIKENATLLKNDLIQKFETAYQKIKEIFSPIAGWFSEKWSGIKDVFKGVKGWFETKFKDAYTAVTNVWANVAGWFSKKWSGIKDVFKGVKGWFETKFKDAYTAVTEAFKGINTWFSEKWKKVKEIFGLGDDDNKVSTYFSKKFTGAYTAVTEAWDGIKGWFQDRWKEVREIFGLGDDNKVSTYFSKKFKGAYTAVTEAFKGLEGFFSKVAGWIITPIDKAVNGVINGINWVFDKVSGKKPLKNWTPPKFEKGSNGLPSDTIGVVNDQAGSTYKELILPPHGKPFIPEGRNVMLPMEKGTKIMPAGQTKALMEGVPKFKDGIGEFFGNTWSKIKDFTGDVLDYLEKPSKILQIAIDKFTDFSGLSKFFIPLATGAVNKVFDSAVKYIGKMFEKTGYSGIDKAIKWAVGIANDNRHGYDQKHRTGPDYDCSSLVTTALKKAGFNIPIGTTSTMYGSLTSAGFKNVTSSVSVGSGNGMKKGDVLLKPGEHTAMYIGDKRIVHASINEFGKTLGGKTGDQTGKEICTKGYYNYPWTYVLRYAKKYKKGIGEIGITDLIPKYSVGGFPEDGLFMANHNELVGKFSDGRTAVANNLNIQKGIEDAAYRGFSRANAENREQENLLRELIEAVKDGKRIVVDGRELVSITDSRRARNGYSFI